MDIKFVLEHEISRCQCRYCLSIWFRFDADGKLGVYRLGSVAPVACATCAEIDAKIEADPGFVASAERWFDV